MHAECLRWNVIVFSGKRLNCKGTGRYQVDVSMRAYGFSCEDSVATPAHPAGGEVHEEPERAGPDVPGHQRRPLGGHDAAAPRVHGDVAQRRRQGLC